MTLLLNSQKVDMKNLHNKNIYISKDQTIKIRDNNKHHFMKREDQQYLMIMSIMMNKIMVNR